MCRMGSKVQGRMKIGAGWEVTVQGRSTGCRVRSHMHEIPWCLSEMVSL